MKSIDARKFDTRIELWQTENVADGFGGSTSNDIKIKDLFARYELPKVGNFNSEQTSIDKVDSHFFIREIHINTNVNFIVYKGNRYTILSFEQTHLRSQIKLKCVKI
jgi:hypothetical protein